jgi:hypothetical protein
LQSLETPERIEPVSVKPIRQLDIVVARIDAWRRGEADHPMSDNESDSSIDWMRLTYIRARGVAERGPPGDDTMRGSRRRLRRRESSVESLRRTTLTIRSKELSRHFEDG